MVARFYQADRKVPCNGCTLCCRGDFIAIHPECGDDPAQYDTVKDVNPLTGQEVDRLRVVNGACVYLTEAGCSIHGRAPAICRKFDCRGLVKKIMAETTRQQRKEMIKNGFIDKELMKRGRELLREEELGRAD